MHGLIVELKLDVSLDLTQIGMLVSSNCALPIVGAYVQTRKVESAQCNVGNDLVLK